MRISTALEVLRRATLGETIDDISRGMHIAKTVIVDLLRPSGYPDVEAIAAYRDIFRQQEERAVWDAAGTLASYAGSVRVDPDLVHAATDNLGREELRTLLAVAVAMLPADLEPVDALEWARVGGRRGRPRKVVA